MRSVLADTNLLLSLITDRDAAQQEAAVHLFEAAAARRTLTVLHQQVLTEMVYVLRTVYERPDREAALALEKLLGLPGTEIVDAVPWHRLLRLWPSEVGEFPDAILAAVALETRAEVATFDRRLATRLKRLGVVTYWR